MLGHLLLTFRTVYMCAYGYACMCESSNLWYEVWKCWQNGHAYSHKNMK